MSEQPQVGRIVALDDKAPTVTTVTRGPIPETVKISREELEKLQRHADFGQRAANAIIYDHEFDANTVWRLVPEARAVVKESR